MSLSVCVCVSAGTESCQGFSSGGGSFISSAATADVNLCVSDRSGSELISPLHTHTHKSTHTHTQTGSDQWLDALEMDFYCVFSFLRKYFSL